MTSYRFTRTFHTVGQGAFYSERIDFADKSPEFIAVYDCGSTTLDAAKGGRLHKRITSDLGNTTPKVDILFISHFDKDHINGCRYLNPKIVVLPFLTKSQVDLLKIFNTIGAADVELSAIVSPEQFFPNSIIYRVSAEVGEMMQIPVSENADILDQPPRTIGNGSTFLATEGTGKRIPCWEYMVYNPNWDDYIKEFEERVTNRGLDFEQMRKEPTGDVVYKNMDQLKEIYNELKNKNRHSLQVYSGSVDRNLILQPVFPNPFNHRTCFRFHCPFYEIHSIGSGCLYTGDITVDEKWLKPYLAILATSGRLANVGTVQIPHHGAYGSNGHKILRELRKDSGEYIVSVITSGEDNRYGHPSARVVTELIRNGSDIVLVTESTTTLFAEIS